MEINKIYQGDCLEVMKHIKDKSIDMILCDLPYGLTSCEWDRNIAFDKLWIQYNRVIKKRGVIVLTAQQSFTTDLINSNRKMFKYEWIWQKTVGTNPMLTKKQPFKKHENICVFYKEQPTYNPQMEIGTPYKDKIRKSGLKAIHLNNPGMKKEINNEGTRYPSSVQLFRNPNNRGVHPTQKPVTLFEYLIKTYTNEGDLVLDNCIGSGTTAVACIKTNRNFIGIEIIKKYVDIANKRINEAKQQLTLFQNSKCEGLQSD